MHLAEIWMSMFLAQTSTFLLAGGEYLVRFPGQQLEQQQQQQKQHKHLRNRESEYNGKRISGTMAEPSCEELRAMWRYSKRQSRAAETSNELPVYRDPFSYNLWEIYPSRSPSTGYRDEYAAEARSRGAGGPLIYGKLVHKAPAGSRLRNGMPERNRAFEEVTRLYGTINRHPPSQRRRLTSFRVAGGGGARGLVNDDEEDDIEASLPQAGSFQHLKELILTERARELQEQRKAKEMTARATILKEMTSGNLRQGATVHELDNTNFLRFVKRIEDLKNYDFAERQYGVKIQDDIGEPFTKGEYYDKEYVLH